MPKSSCQFWESYWGHLATEIYQEHTFDVYGFENISSEFSSKDRVEFSGKGTLWGYVQEGSLKADAKSLSWAVNPGQWFCLPYSDGVSLSLSNKTRIFVLNGVNHHGLAVMGGPVEKNGRLQYIDGCTDTLLYCPPVLGDPCLNLLHFPAGVDQTAHYHPTSRSGMINRGYGHCVSSQDDHMKEGTIFFLPANTRHKFRTDAVEMDVISFHPDSDWGPTHEVHPMINRTWGTNGDDN